MKKVNSEIIQFIDKHHVMALATSQNNIPYTCACFYVYDEINNGFIFSSDLPTKHAQQILLNREAAATIFLETKKIGLIQGLQLSGTIQLLQNDILERSKKTYHKKYPYSLLMSLTLWAFYPYHMKLTDNRLGFGKKLIWDATDMD